MRRKAPTVENQRATGGRGAEPSDDLAASRYRFLLRRISARCCSGMSAQRPEHCARALIARPSGCVLAIVAWDAHSFALLRPQSALGQAPIT